MDEATATAVVGVEALDDLIGALRRRGFRVLGPTVRDGAIVYDELETAAELPVGWTDRQEAATYRLERREDEARFGYAVGRTPPLRRGPAAGSGRPVCTLARAPGGTENPCTRSVDFRMWVRGPSRTLEVQ